MRVTALVTGVEIHSLVLQSMVCIWHMASCQLSRFAFHGSVPTNVLFLRLPPPNTAAHRVALFLEETSESLLGSFIRKGHCHLLSMMSMATCQQSRKHRKRFLPRKIQVCFQATSSTNRRPTQPLVPHPEGPQKKSLAVQGLNGMALAQANTET